MRLMRADTANAAATFLTFDRGDNAALGRINCSESGLTCAIANASDRRIKHDITDTSLDISTLQQINFHDYKMNADPDGIVRHGVIAQELYGVFPDAVAVGGDDATTSPWMVEYQNLIPLTMRSVQQIASAAQSAGLTFASSSYITTSSDVSSILAEPAVDAVSYLSDRVAQGVKLAKEVVAQKIVAVVAYIGSLFANEVHAKDKICIGATCVTESELKRVLDEKAPQAGAGGNSASSTDSTSSPQAADRTAPIISLGGSAGTAASTTNTISVGTSFSDLVSATDETAPQNPTIYVQINGGPQLQIQNESIDTSTSTTYTLNYSATDAAGNTAHAERTLIVQSPL